MKKIISVLFLAMFFAFCLNTSATAAETKTLTVEGIKYIVNGNVQEDVSLPSGVSYDESTSTITLDNYHTSSPVEGYGISYNGSAPLTVIVNGNNTIETKSTTGGVEAIYTGTSADLHIIGNGTLNLTTLSGNTCSMISGKNITIDNIQLNIQGMIYSYNGEIEINQTKLQLIAVKNTSSYSDSGSMLYGNSCKLNNSEVTINTGEDGVNSSIIAPTLTIANSDVKISGNFITITASEQITIDKNSSVEQNTTSLIGQRFYQTRNFNLAPEHHFYLKRIRENGQWNMNKTLETSMEKAFSKEGTGFVSYNNRSQYLLITAEKLSGYPLETETSFTNSTVGSGTSSNTPVKVSGISKKIAAGKKIQLTANQSVTWISNNTKVATVSQSGLVTFKKNSGGKSVIITAFSKNGKKASYKIISMKGIVKKVSISGKTSVKAGKSLKLKGKVKATAKANKTLLWTSSNTKYAKVSSSGKVKSYKAGKGKTVKITAAATDGSGKKKTITIKIK